MSWDEIAGHARARDLLVRTLRSGLVPHAWLFQGPEGVGKALVARAFARDLVCGEGGCGACVDCRDAAAGTHPDQFLADGAEGVGIDGVRDLIAWASRKAFRRGRKVAVLRDAERLTEEAQNALLKTLEEPPPGTVLVLVTARPLLLLETVRSRCQVLRFGPLTPGEVRSVLSRRPDVPGDRLDFLALVTGGSPGRALEFVGSEAEADLRAVTGFLGGEEAPEALVAALFEEERAPDSGLARARARLRRIAAFGAAVLREVVLRRAGAEGLAVLDPGDMSALERCLPGEAAEEALRAFLALARRSEGPLTPSLALAEVLLTVPVRRQAAGVAAAGRSAGGGEGA